MAQRRHSTSVDGRDQSAETAPGHLLEVHALDRILGAEGEDPVQIRFYQPVCFSNHLILYGGVKLRYS